ncbi:MAG: hypothetical protein Q9227_002791 [Pyrenula ochraceoflavens]
MSDLSDSEIQERREKLPGPYTSKNPVPTVQGYREGKDKLKSQLEKQTSFDNTEQRSGAIEKAKAPVRAITGKENRTAEGDPYPTINQNEEVDDKSETTDTTGNGRHTPATEEDTSPSGRSDSQSVSDNKNTPPQQHPSDPKERRRAMKNMERDAAGREVTDPVTHLPIVQKDATDKDLAAVGENEPAAGTVPESSTGIPALSKSTSQLERETVNEQETHSGMATLFPPPNFQTTEVELSKLYRQGLLFGIVSLCASSLVAMASLFAILRIQSRSWASMSLAILPFGFLGLAVILNVYMIPNWLKARAQAVWEENVWTAASDRERNSHLSRPESTKWLNSFLASVWPLINPDLFVSLADTLEDVMQASLPKVVRMVSVDDIGQGSEAFQILGVKWLPTGAAARSVAKDGKLKSKSEQKKNDRMTPGEGEIDQDDSNNKDSKEEEAEGMEAEQGDFVNLEIAFAYKARTSGKSLKTKSNNAHLYLKFYLPTRLAIPVWVELRGFIGTMRIRCQLTPDPPFIALSTITFLGQPKADLSCVPLSKHNLNIMDVPMISSFVQSSIDAALAEYVAPKSLTLNLQDMLVGDDFKKDTLARGVIAVRIRKAYGFKAGDTEMMGLKEGSADPYVSVGWGKFGKKMGTTRRILEEMEPSYDEWMYLLVGPEELNAQELLRVQLWDSDRNTADDDLGRIDVPIKTLMENQDTLSKMQGRSDGFIGMDTDEKWPGTLDWAVGYFPKTRVTDHLVAQSSISQAQTVQELHDAVSENARHKLREAKGNDESNELVQQTEQDFYTKENEIIVSAPPSQDAVSGVLSVQIHQITGLELQQSNNSKKSKGLDEDDQDTDDLPSAYCTIIINHNKAFRTRTKPKNGKPFYNAGTERFIRDWRNTEVMLSVRDSRVHENDPLLGIVYLPLNQIFKERSQVNSIWPLVGGLGYGRVRISMVFRSVDPKLPQELRGWDYATVEVRGNATAQNLAKDLQGLRMKLRAGIGSGKMQYDKNSGGNGAPNSWSPKHNNECVYLAVRKRYSTCLTIELRKSMVGPDSTSAFGVFWLKDIPDEEEREVNIDLYSGKDASFKRASTCVDYRPDGKSPMATLKLRLKICAGLSGWHRPLAGRTGEEDLHDVIEVLETAMDNREGREDNSMSNKDDSDDDSSSSSSSSEQEPEVDRNQGDGPLAKVKDYKDHRKQLHRRHRGVMQWKGARTIDWVHKKALKSQNAVWDKFQHNDTEPGIETEV